MEKGKGKDIKIDIAEAKKRYLIQSSQYREKRLRGEQGKKKQRSAKVPKLVTMDIFALGLQGNHYGNKSVNLI